MNYVWDFAILTKYSRLFWIGIGWTLAYTVGTVILGAAIGLLVGILRMKRWRVVDWLLIAYVELFRCTPLLRCGRRFRPCSIASCTRPTSRTTI